MVQRRRASRCGRTAALDELPEVLTVEEAAAVLRIGRGAAYELARQWRESGGRSGLPVVTLGPVAARAPGGVAPTARRRPRRPGQRTVGAGVPGPAREPSLVIDASARTLRRTLGLTAWAALEELLLDAAPQAVGRAQRAGERPGARRALGRQQGHSGWCPAPPDVGRAGAAGGSPRRHPRACSPARST